jgi:tetratricopeptide (TPR) repeat protein
MRELGMADDAIVHYRKALELMPDDPDALIGLGAAQCDAGKIKDAISTLQKAVTKHPDSGRAYANLGVALEATGRDREAVGAYAKAVARFDAQLLEAKDDETAADVAARRRWARIQHAELLERLELWPQAVLEYRRLYEEEQALAEAEEQAAREAEEEDEGSDDDDEAGEAGAGVPDSAGASSDEAAGDVGQTLLDAGSGDGRADTEHDHSRHDHDHDHDHDEEEEETGRIGLERVFARLVQRGHHDLAFLVLDDLGGELADARTRATYAIYDPGDGMPCIMVEHWDGNVRERLTPGDGAKLPD